MRSESFIIPSAPEEQSSFPGEGVKRRREGWSHRQTGVRHLTVNAKAEVRREINRMLDYLHDKHGYDDDRVEWFAEYMDWYRK